MCPFLSRCNNVMNPDSSIIDLGCTTSRSWAEINDQFGEPLGSYRKRDRFGLTCCHHHTSQISGMSDLALDCGEMIHHDHHLDAGMVLDISFRKQQQQLLLEDLYRKVLIQNTTKTVQQEIKKTILQSIF